MTFIEADERFRNLRDNLPTDGVNLVKRGRATGTILPKIEEKLKVLGVQPNALQR